MAPDFYSQISPVTTSWPREKIARFHLCGEIGRPKRAQGNKANEQSKCAHVCGQGNAVAARDLMPVPGWVTSVRAAG
jgi:hypothetical protein